MWILWMIPLVPIAIIVLLIVLIAKKSNGGSGTSESFERRIRSIYMYMVMGLSLILLITGLVLIWTNAVQLILPDEPAARITNPEEWLQNQRNNAIGTLITSAAAAVIGGVLFLLHGKGVRKGDRYGSKSL